MNKTELIKTVADKTGLSQKKTAETVNEVIETISEAVSNGQKVQIVGFGTFEPRKRKAREGRNPATGEKMEIPSQTVPAFKPGKELKEKV